MPYIQQEDRYQASFNPGKAGDLSFRLTKVILEYWETRRNYQAINDILGALTGATLEFYRRVVVPYEDKKREENGDVY